MTDRLPEPEEGGLSDNLVLVVLGLFSLAGLATLVVFIDWAL